MTRRVGLIGAVLATVCSGISLALPGSVASAQSRGRTVCSTVSGTEPAAVVTISGCVDSHGADTGGGSQPLPLDVFAYGGTIKWLSGRETTLGPATNVTELSSWKCGVPPTLAGFRAIRVSGPVTSDSAGFKVPGTYKVELCYTQVLPGTPIFAPKPLKVR
jgi:hypothetical protein